MKIEIISGSPRMESVTKRVALHLHKTFSRVSDVEAGLVDIARLPLAPVESVWTSADEAPANLSDVAQRVFDADAYILVTPEYNGSYSPALKNFLDHFPKREGKVIGIVTASTGSFGGIRAALQLQHLVFALFAIGSPRMLIVPEVQKKFDENGVLEDSTFADAVDTFVNDFLWLSRATQRGGEARASRAA